MKTVGTSTVTASDSDVISPTYTVYSHTAIGVNSGNAVKLQLLLPGETGAPGTSSGFTGTPSSQVAGTNFVVTVQCVDANWNINTTTSPQVTISTSDTFDTEPTANLSNGTNTYNITFKKAGSWTLSASDVDGASPTYTSTSNKTITASSGTAVKLQLLLPGETANPGSTYGYTGTAIGQTAGTQFTVTVNAVDANWNRNTTVAPGVTVYTSDANTPTSGQQTLTAGTSTFNVLFKTMGNWTVTSEDTDGDGTTYTINTHPQILVSPNTAVKLLILAPGETAAPGNTAQGGKTGTANSQYAGVQFTITVNAVDNDWNLNTSAVTSEVSITTSDPNDNETFAFLSNGSKTFNVKFKTVGSWTITATDTDGSEPSYAEYVNSAISTGSGIATKLQLLVPGETAAAGTSTGKTAGLPTDRTAGTQFTVTVNCVDDEWNKVTIANPDVTLTSTDSNATLPGQQQLANGARTFNVTFKTSGVWTITATDTSASPTYTTNISPSITCQTASAAKLQLILPGETAEPGTGDGVGGTASVQTTGIQFTTTINCVDAYWNKVTDANPIVRITTSDNYDTNPQGTLVNGTLTLNVTPLTAGSDTLTASDEDATEPLYNFYTHSSITVNPNTAVKLQVIAPGETASAGNTSANGFVGSASTRIAGTQFTVTVNCVDAYWNINPSATPQVTITTQDANDTEPSYQTLSSGTKTYNVTFKTAGTSTVTATDTDGDATTYTTYNHSALNIIPGSAAKLQIILPGETAAPGTTTGKTGTANNPVAGTAFNAKVNCVDTNWNLVTGTNPDVAITTSDTYDTEPSTETLVNGTKNFTVNLKTAGSNLTSITATDVAPAVYNPYITQNLTVNPGTGVKLQVLIPGETAVPGDTANNGKVSNPTARTVGVAFDVTVNCTDAQWNTNPGANPTVTITSSDTNAGLPAASGLSTGTKTFSVILNTAGSASITATDTDGAPPTYTASTSPSATIYPAAAVKLQILLPGETAAPGNTSVGGKTGTPVSQIAGTAFNTTVNAVDDKWNVCPTANPLVHLITSDSNATMPTDATLSDGYNIFNVTLVTGGNSTITASDVSGTSITYTSSTSASVLINPNTGTKLQVLVPGETAAPGTGQGKNGTPVLQTAGTLFVVTVQCTDDYWNKNTSISVTANLTTSDVNDVNPDPQSLTLGTRTFNVTLLTGSSSTVTATDVDGVSPTYTLNTSPAIPVTFGTGVKLQVLIPGETANPGDTSSATPGKTGTPTNRIAGDSFIVTVNSVDNYWNTNTTITQSMTITTSDVNDTEPSSANLSLGSMTYSITLKTSGASHTITASDTDPATPLYVANTSPTFIANPGDAAKLQLLVPGETAAAGTSTGKTGTPTTRTAGTSFNVTVQCVDAFFNIVPSAAPNVTVSTSDLYDTEPTSAILAGGTGTFSITLKTANTGHTISATSGTYTGDTSPAFDVNTNNPIKLQVLLPGETAVAGSSSGKTGPVTSHETGATFTVTVNCTDDYFNKVVSTSPQVKISTNDPNDDEGDANRLGSLSSGTRNFNISCATVGTWTVTGTDVDGVSPSYTANTSSNVSITPGPAVKLQLLVPGETAVLGTSSGKTGTPTTRIAGTTFVVTVNSADAAWNTTTDTPQITITTTDPKAGALMPSAANLINGSLTFNVALATAGSSYTLTASDTDAISPTLTASTSPVITVWPGAATHLHLTNITTTTTLTSGILDSATSIPVVSTAGFPAPGSAGIDNERFTYATVTPSSFEGCTRATGGTLAASHSSGAYVSIPLTAGVSAGITITVEAHDAYDNRCSIGSNVFTDTIAFSSDDTSASPPANYTFISGDAGIKNLSNQLTMVTSYRPDASPNPLLATHWVKVEDITNGSVTAGQENGIFVQPASASKFAFSSPSGNSDVSAGNNVGIVAQLADPYNNPYYQSGVSCTLYVSDIVGSTGTLSTPNATTDVNGKIGISPAITYTVATTSGNNATVTVSSASPSATGKTGTMTTVGASADHLEIVTFPSETYAGTDSTAYIVIRRDFYNNYANSQLQSVLPTSSSTGANKRFSKTTPSTPGSAVTSITWPAGSRLTSAVNTTTETTIYVSSTNLFQTPGCVLIDSEKIYYTSKTANTLENCTRGAFGSTPAIHSNNAQVITAALFYYYDEKASYSPPDAPISFTITAEIIGLPVPTITKNIILHPTTISFLAFANSPVTTSADTYSAVLTVQAQDSYSNANIVSSNTSVSLSSNSIGTASFSIDTVNPTTTVTIPSGQNSVNFYYKDTKVGVPLTIDVLSTDANIYVETTGGFSSSGTIKIDSETITYTGKTGTSFTGCTRGGGAASHSIGATVYNYPAVQITAIAAGLGNATQTETITPDLSLSTPMLVFLTFARTLPATNIDATLSSGIGLGDITITIADTESFPASGALKIDNEVIAYKSKNPTSFLECVRGYNGTSASTHSSGATATALHFMKVQVQDKFKNPANAPGNTTLNFESIPQGATFSTDAVNFTSTWTTIPIGQSTAYFYFKSSKVGTPNIILNESPSASPNWTQASQTQTVTAGPITKVFITSPFRTIMMDEGTTVGTGYPIYVETRDASDNISPVTGAVTKYITITGASGDAEFSIGTWPGTSNIMIGIAPGFSSGLLHYKDKTAGISTRLTSAITSAVTTIPVASTTGFPSSGAITIENEIITYTSIDATNFLMCTRGAAGTTGSSPTTPDAHNSSTKVAKPTTLTATPNVGYGWTPASQYITVTPGSAASYEVLHSGTTVVNSMSDVTIKAKDGRGNIASGSWSSATMPTVSYYTGIVNFTTNSSGSTVTFTPSASYTYTINAQGVYALQLSDTNAENITITATDVNTPSITGTSITSLSVQGVTVTPGATEGIISPAGISQGDQNKAVTKLTIKTSGSSTNWTQLRLDRVGTAGADSDITSVKLWRSDNNGSFEASSDVLVTVIGGPFTFVGGICNLTGFSELIASNNKVYFVTFSVADTANPNNYHGAKIANTAYFTTSSVPVAANNFPISSSTLTNILLVGATTVTLNNPVSFPNATPGVPAAIKIESEIIKYTGKSGNQLTGLSRGQYGTPQEQHSAGTEVNLVSVIETSPGKVYVIPTDISAIKLGSGITSGSATVPIKYKVSTALQNTVDDIATIISSTATSVAGFYPKGSNAEDKAIKGFIKIDSEIISYTDAYVDSGFLIFTGCIRGVSDINNPFGGATSAASHTMGATIYKYPATDGIPNAGNIKIDNEIIKYNSKTDEVLNVESRGINGTTPDSHSAETLIYQYAEQGDLNYGIVKIVLNTDKYSAEWVQMSITKGGTPVTGLDTDITAVKIYKDGTPGQTEYGDGIFDYTADTLISAGTEAFSSGSVTIDFSSNSQNITTTPKTYFLVYKIDPSATISNTFGAKLTTKDSIILTLGGGNTVENVNFPFATEEPLIHATVDTISVTAEDNTDVASAIQSTKDVMLVRLKLSVNKNTAKWTQISLSRLGVGQDVDISAIKIYKYVTGAVSGSGKAVLCVTNLTATISSSASSISVTSTTGFPGSGYVQIDEEKIQYSGTTSTTFTGLTRGVQGTTAIAHSTGALVGDALISSGSNVFTSGSSSITLTKDQTISTVFPFVQTYFVAIDINNFATIGSGMLGIHIDGYDGTGTPPYTVVLPDILSNTTPSHDVLPIVINEYTDTITVSGIAENPTESGNPNTILQGKTNVSIEKLSLSTDKSTAIWTGTKFERIGAGVDSDITGIKIYKDAGSAGVFDPATDTLVTSISGFTGGLANITLITPTSLLSDINSSDTTINVVLSTSFPSTGTLRIDNELISYTGIAGNSFTGCTRGTSGTSAVSHKSSTFVSTMETILTPTPQIYFVVVNIGGSAPPGNKIGVKWTDSTYWTFKTPNAIYTGFASFQSAENEIVPTPRTMYVQPYDVTSGTTLGGAGLVAGGSETVITVSSTANFTTPNPGSADRPYYTMKIGNELITYTSRTATTFTGCIRGSFGTSKDVHNPGELVEKYVFQGDKYVAMEKLVLSVDDYQVKLKEMRVSRISGGVDADIEAVKIFRDDNGTPYDPTDDNGTLDPDADTDLGFGTFSYSTALITLPTSGTPLSPTEIIPITNLTTLSGDITNVVTTIPVVSTASFSGSGVIKIENELIVYTGKDATNLTGCTRGANSSAAASHTTGTAVAIASKTYFVAYSFADAATDDVQVAASWTNKDTFTLNSPNVVSTQNFAFTSGSPVVHATNDKLIVDSFDRAMAYPQVTQGQGSQPGSTTEFLRDPFIILQLRLKSDKHNVKWTHLKLTMNGTDATATDNDIYAIKIYKDVNNNDNYENGTDTLVSYESHVYMNKETTIQLQYPQDIGTTLQKYFVTYSIQPTATIGVTLRVRIEGPSSFTLATTRLGAQADTVQAFSEIVSSGVTIQEYLDKVTVSGINLITSATPSPMPNEQIALVRFTMQTDVSEAGWEKLTLLRKGQSVDTDISAIKIFKDSNNSGSFEADKDTLVNSGTILSAGIDPSATVVPVTSTEGFPSSGYIKIGSEVISYSGKTANSFTGIGRAASPAAGIPATKSAYHPIGAFVTDAFFVNGRVVLNITSGTTPASYQKITPAVQTYYIVYLIAPDAIPNNWVGVKCDLPAYFTITSPNSMNTEVGFPIQSEDVQIGQIKITLSASSIATVALRQGFVKSGMIKFALNTSNNECYLNGMQIKLLKAYASIDRIRVYRDDGEGNFDKDKDTEIGVAQGPFPSELASITLTTPEVINTGIKTFYIAIDVNIESPIDGRVGVKLASGDYFIFTAGTIQDFVAGGYESSTPRIVPKFTPLSPVIELPAFVADPSKLAILALGAIGDDIKFDDIQFYVTTQDVTAEYVSENVPDSSWNSVGANSEFDAATNLDPNVPSYVFVRLKNQQYKSIPTKGKVEVDLTPPNAPEKLAPGIPKTGRIYQTKVGTYSVTWNTAIEDKSGIKGYIVEEKLDTSPVWKSISTTDAPVRALGFRKTQKMTTGISEKSGKATLLFDKKELNHIYYYRVKAINGAGKWGDYSVVAPGIVVGELPKEVISMLANYPNPFDTRKSGVEGQTTITYLLNQDADVTIQIYDLLGHLAWTKECPKALEGGQVLLNNIVWDGKNDIGEYVSKGGYICRIVIKSEQGMKQIIRKIGVLH
ncbi:MAG: hypothetical protein AABY84_09680 [Candidatus Firestonebacteria bacterium]